MSSRVAVLYDRIGGETVIRQLVETFYDIIEHEPEGRPLFLLHLRGHGVAHSRIEQFNFLSGFLGGPRLYVERYGHSDVRQMHAHVEVDRAARDAWLRCMEMAIDRVGLVTDVKSALMKHFTRVADMLINKPQEAESESIA
ncbi:MAG TPA: group II truncated hemoglobin [Terriglobales bacterium]|nr:group II truncated hemoglobin [Terriglobales bacterium]